MSQPTVYLIHFDGLLSHARHYLGWTSNLAARLRDHASGNGAKLMAAVSERKIPWRVVRTWSGDRNLERQLKRRKDAASLCPECRAKRLAYRALWKRLRRNNGNTRTVRC